MTLDHKDTIKYICKTEVKIAFICLILFKNVCGQCNAGGPRSAGTKGEEGLAAISGQVGAKVGLNNVWSFYLCIVGEVVGRKWQKRH